jgi:hypothetical protein
MVACGSERRLRLSSCLLTLLLFVSSPGAVAGESSKAAAASGNVRRLVRADAQEILRAGRSDAARLGVKAGNSSNGRWYWCRRSRSREYKRAERRTRQRIDT